MPPFVQVHFVKKKLNQGDIVEIFVQIDDFCKGFEPKWEESLLRSSKRHRRRSRGLSMSEMMTILVFFHCSGFRNFKWYYFNLMKCGKGLFPGLLSYQRFVALSKEMVVPLCAYVWQECRGENTGISFIDSTKIEVCGRKRISKNKVFQGLASIGKSSVGWFYGFKLHLVINDKGELLSFAFTPGNVDDRKPVPELTKELEGRLYGDKGYISKYLFEGLMAKGLKLVTSIRRNMKNKLVEMVDKVLLRKRAIIETVNDQLKNLCQLEHTRHRSVTGFMLNALSALAAYSHRPRKPSLAGDTNLDLQP